MLWLRFIIVLLALACLGSNPQQLMVSADGYNQQIQSVDGHVASERNSLDDPDPIAVSNSHATVVVVAAASIQLPSHWVYTQDQALPPVRGPPLPQLC